ncbi:L,D-transpeptidase family protein [Leifsonia sp. 2MCAF36]|uniref:L,D-transpeptidase family protein n=1 Tax=Leifsonia sp. 2MCAF36 TaxID=3232988 RepID=UPI003F996E79
MSNRLVASVAIATAIMSGLLLTGCASEAAPTHSPAPHPTVRSVSPTPTPTPSAPSAIGTSATATSAQVAVYGSPNGSVIENLANPQPSGAPLTFLVASSQGAWLQVDLAQRPNGSTGWIQADSVALHSLVYSLQASTEQNTLTLLKNGEPVKTYSAATGTGGTPTPHGSFYITELLEPTNGGYGPFAFGLSAFSDVLSSFGGGPGQIGLHGTDDAGSIGHAASHGCIRLANPDITELAGLLPLGTPITIS